jgi:hypothetical protein
MFKRFGAHLVANEQQPIQISDSEKSIAPTPSIQLTANENIAEPLVAQESQPHYEFFRH